MIDTELLQEIIKWVIGAGIVLTLTITITVKITKNKKHVIQKSRGSHSPNINIGNYNNGSGTQNVSSETDK